VFTVTADILPAVEPGILPGGMGVWFEKSLRFGTLDPGGKMPPSTAAKMAATTLRHHGKHIRTAALRTLNASNQIRHTLTVLRKLARDSSPLTSPTASSRYYGEELLEKACLVEKRGLKTAHKNKSIRCTNSWNNLGCR
jgi:hypothetical protein